jgi:hypothetical protein
MFRRRFADVIRRQLDLFERDHADLLADLRAAERAYERAAGEEAEERYADVDELVETAGELLANLRDAYIGSLDEAAGIAYADAFRRAAARRFGSFALELEES